VKCARFRGGTSVEFLDERTLDGDVLTQVEEAISFVARNTAQAIRITGRPERETVPGLSQ
jgi:predicted HTH transcriptional regulator